MNTATHNMHQPSPQDGLSPERPWPGLAAYTEADRAYFFGRDNEAEDLTRRIRRERLTVLFGQSGLGKTSLLKAGLFPRLRAADLQPIYLRLDYTAQARPLGEQVLAAISEVIQREALDAPLPNSGEGLWGYFHRSNLEWWSPRNRLLTPVLVFDQFEEIFTLGRTDAQASQTFLDELADLTENRQPEQAPGQAVLDGQDNSRVSGKLLLSFREDFLPDFEALKGRIHSLFLNRVRLERLSGEAACGVLQESGGHLLAPGLAQDIVRFVAAEKKPRPLPELTVEPALLSVVCRELNERRISRHAERIGADMLELGQHEILRDLVGRALIDQPAALVEELEEHLLTDGGHRAQYPLQDLIQRAGVGPEAIYALVTQRILRVEPRGEVEWVELTHDLLAPVVRENRDRRRAALELERNRRKMRRIWAFAGVMVVVAIAEVLFFLALFKANAAGDHNLGLVLASKAETSFSKGENDLGQIYAAHALAKLDDDRAFNLRRQLQLQRLVHQGLPILPVPWAEYKKSSWDSEHYSFLALSPDGRNVAAKSSKDRISLWDISSGKVLFTMDLNGKEIVNAAISGRTIAVASNDSNIGLFDVNTGKLLIALQGDGRSVKEVVFSPDGRTLLSVSKEMTARAWDVPTGQQIIHTRGLGKSVTTMAFSPDGSTLAYGSEIGVVHIRSIARDKPSTILNAQKTSVQAITYSPDGQTLAVATSNGVTLWNVHTGKSLSSIASGISVSKVIYSPDGRMLATASSSGVRLWNIASGLPVASLSTNYDIESIAFSFDGHSLVTGVTNDGERTPYFFRVFDLSSVTSVVSLTGHQASVSNITFSPNGEVVATSSKDNTIRLSNAVNGETISTLIWDDIELEEPKIIFSPDGHSVAGLSYLRIILWDVATGKVIYAHPSLDINGNRHFLSISPDFRTVAFLYPNPRKGDLIVLNDVSSGNVIASFPGDGSNSDDVKFSPDGRTMAIASSKGVHLWDIKSGKLRSTITTNDFACMSRFGGYFVAFSKDGHSLAFGKSTCIKFWNIADEKVTSTVWPYGWSFPNQWLRPYMSIEDIEFKSTPGNVFLEIRLNRGRSGLLVDFLDIGSGKLVASSPSSVSDISPDLRKLAVKSEVNGHVTLFPVPFGESAIPNWLFQAKADERRYLSRLDGIRIYRCSTLTEYLDGEEDTRGSVARVIRYLFGAHYQDE